MPSSPQPWACRAFSLDVRSLALFRAALGAVVCADALLRTRDFRLMFAPDGLFPLDALRLHYGDRWAWSLAFLIDAEWWGAVVLALEGIAGACLCAGVSTRLASIAAWVAVVSVVRRTAPATNAGDIWLCCLLWWGMFLPLGAVWSIDAWRRGRPLNEDHRICSVPSAALVLQVAAVYLGAGLSKWNAAWLSGDAVSFALSVHDHGTHLGSLVAATPWLSGPLTRAVMPLELLGPVLLVAAPLPRIRLALVIIFVLFHVAIAVLMSVGLFAYVGMAAWLAVLPSCVWSHDPAPAVDESHARRASAADWLCIAGLAVAAMSFLHITAYGSERPFPAPLRALVRLTCLDQDWGMFGDVPRQSQWVYGRAELADGSVVDLLRDGRPLEPVLPTGGFTTLPHHRWHKLFWELPRPPQRVFSPSIASALVRDWNRRQPSARQVTSLEIRFARLGDTPAPGTSHELLLATWPPRDAGGRGNLDRWLEKNAPPPVD
jgi:hypothetical protein